MNLTRAEAQNRELSSRAKRPGSLLAVLGGKGGVGKTNVATNVAVAASRLGARVLLVDGDLGLANVDVLLGLTPRCTAAEILSGERELADAILEGPAGVHVVPAASARMDLAASRPAQLAALLGPLLECGHAYDCVIVDVGAGIGPSAISLAAVCDRAWIVTTPEPTSVTDAYGTLKVLRRTAPDLPTSLLVNDARSESQALATHSQLERIAARFLDTPLPLAGIVPRDSHVEDAVAKQKAVVEQFPTAPASRRLIELAGRVLAGPPPPESHEAGIGEHVSQKTWKRFES